MKKLLFLLVALLPSLFPGVSFGQETEYVGSALWDGVNNCCISGNYAYCAYRNGLAILDLSDLSNPSFVNTYYVGGNGSDVTVSGSYAYFADREKGLLIFSLENPAEPELISQRQTPGDCRRVFVDSDYAYIADGFAGLSIIDISDRQNPRYMRSQNIADTAQAVYVRWRYAYVAGDTNGLKVVDVQIPSSPRVVSSWLGSGVDIAIAGNCAFMASKRGAIAILNISSPLNPIWVSTYHKGTRVAVSGIHMLAADGGSTDIVNITDYEDPVRLSYYRNAGNDVGFLSSGTRIYLAGVDNDFEVVDISDDENPVSIGIYDQGRSVRSLCVAENFAYIADYYGLRIVDIQDRSNPILAGSYLSEVSGINGVYAAGDFAYLIHDTPLLEILNVSDPETPFQAATIDLFPGFGRDLVVSGNYAYIIDDIGGFSIYNIEDPTNPQLADTLSLPRPTRRICLDGSYVYVACQSNGFQVIDVSDPENPAAVSSTSGLGYVEDIYAVNGFAYLAAHNNGLHIMDVSDPANPVRISGVNLPGYAWGVSVRGDYAYLACIDMGVRIIDISDPYNPVLADEYNTPGYAEELWNDDNYIYVADSYSLLILNYTPTDVGDDTDAIPESYSLIGNYPNPFNSSTAIRYELPSGSHVNISIYDMLGRKVQAVQDGLQPAGCHQVIFDASELSSGIYFYRLQAGDYTSTKKMIFIK